MWRGRTCGSRGGGRAIRRTIREAHLFPIFPYILAAPGKFEITALYRKAAKFYAEHVLCDYLEGE